MSPELQELVIRWQRALVELVQETGKPQPMRIVGHRAGLDLNEYVMACAIATVKGITIRLILDEDEIRRLGYRNEFLPAGEW